MPSVLSLEGQVLQHLQNVHNGTASVDVQLLRKYELQFLGPVEADATDLDRACVIIRQILSFPVQLPDSELLRLLATMMPKIPFARIVEGVSEDHVAGWLANAESGQLAELLEAVTLRARDKDAVAFVDRHRLVPVMLQILLDSDRPVPSSILSFVRKFAATYPSEAHVAEWDFLQRYRDQIFDDARKFSIFASATQIVVGSGAAPPWLSDLFLQSWTSLRHAVNELHMHDVLLEAVLFYVLLCSSVPEHWLEGFVSELLHLLETGPAEEHLLVFYSLASGDLIEAMANGTEGAWRSCLQFLARNPSLLTPELFVRCPPCIVADKRGYFQEKLANKTFSGTDKLTFDSLLHLIDDETFFRMLTESILCEDNLKNISQDRLYAILRQLLLYNYSAKYLFDEMPYIVSTYLVSVDRSLVNPLVWKLKLEAVHEIVTRRTISLGLWEQGLKSCLYEMQNGRRFRDTVPEVRTATLTS